MSLVKQSQSLNLDGVRISQEELPKFLNHDIGEIRLIPKDQDDALDDDKGHFDGGVISIEVDDHDPQAFTLPQVPGGDDQDEIPEPADIEVEEPHDDVEISDDPRRWTISTFMPWLNKMMNSVPRHTGRDVVGCERAIAHLEYLIRECSRAARSDLNGELDIDLLEKARDSLHEGVKSLKDRIEKIEASKRPNKKKKKAFDEDDGFVKEAQKAPSIGGVFVTVPLLISSLAESCINGTVSAGRDIEDIFVKLSKEYDLTKREKLELIQLLSDMNYPVRRDLGMPLDKPIDVTSPDNVNWMQQFPG